MNKFLLVSSVLSFSLLATSAFASNYKYGVNLYNDNPNPGVSAKIKPGDSSIYIDVNAPQQAISTNVTNFSVILGEPGKPTYKFNCVFLAPTEGSAIYLDFASNSQLFQDIDGNKNHVLSMVVNTGSPAVPTAQSPYCKAA